MPKYNLDSLGSEEFERLCQSLVQQIIGAGAKVYGMGKDGAREATFHGRAPYPSKIEQWDGNWIFQAKFHDVGQIGPKKARDAIVAELDDELAKITEKYEHPCDNYILMTNVSLTPAFEKGTKDTIDLKVAPKYNARIGHIHVWGADEICRFLDGNPGIRQTYSNYLVTGDVIASLLRLVERDRTDVDELIELYCEGCFAHEQYAALDDAGDFEDKRIALQKVFTDLDVKPPELPKDTELLERLPAWLRQAADDEHRTSALSYLLDDSLLGMVLIGGPGEGKSTLGQYAVQIQRARLIGKLAQLGDQTEVFEKCTARIPFRVLLREYAQWISRRENSDSLFDYLGLLISRQCGRDVKSELVHTVLKSNAVILVLDGLDEVPEKTLRAKVMDNILSFVNQVRDVLKGDLRVVATTRPSGYSKEFDPGHYLHLTLQSLSPDKAQSYARQWTLAREPVPQERERIRSTFDICLADKVVSVLTHTPLQVTILLVVIRAKGTPPNQREELFERYMDVIYTREQKKRPELLRTEADTIYGLHKYLAYVLHKRAETDSTAALMDMREFEQKVREYVGRNPVLTPEELENKTRQIIAEAWGRLVLIESPREGIVGFGLTTTREFFAAAHLVDTARDTKERDLRYKAIARSPHWRNVALFFAGRVGRTRPGEAPSMVDVCREIDTERFDRFLRRGAQLVMEMVDDRALREAHNQIGAIQHGLTLFDVEQDEDSKALIDRLRGMPEIYRERVVRPWIEGKLKACSSSGVKQYANAYRDLFGATEAWLSAVAAASRSSSDELKVWSLLETIRSNVVDTHSAALLEELLESLSIEDVTLRISVGWRNIGSFSQFSMSARATHTLASAFMAGINRMRFRQRQLPYESLVEQVHKAVSDDAQDTTSVLLRGVAELCLWSQSPGRRSPTAPDPNSLEVDLPLVVHPWFRDEIAANTDALKRFSQMFLDSDIGFARIIAAVFDFLVQPCRLDKYLTVAAGYRSTELPVNDLEWVLTPIVGRLPENEAEASRAHEALAGTIRAYEQEDALTADIVGLSSLLCTSSSNVANHPLKAVLWLRSGCDPDIAKFTDPKIAGKICDWFESHALPRNAIETSPTPYLMDNPDLEACEAELLRVEKRVIGGRPRFDVIQRCLQYEWHSPLTDQERPVGELARRLLDRMLQTGRQLDFRDLFDIQIVFWSALAAGMVQDNHLCALYSLMDVANSLGGLYWIVQEHVTARPLLESMILHPKREVAHVAAVGLYGVLYDMTRGTPGAHLAEPWLADRFWELSNNAGDPWRANHISAMQFCDIEWAKTGEEWLRAIIEASGEQRIVHAWSDVIRGAGCKETIDREALLGLLLHILDHEGTFPRDIRVAALHRLRAIVAEIEPIGFEEPELGLP